jgi:hypothetical protein
MSLLETISVSDNESDDIIFTTTEILLRKSGLWNVSGGGSGESDAMYGSDSDNQTLFANDSYRFEHKEYIFDRKDVRYVFITLYSLVFCFCFFGKSAAINNEP